MMQAASWFCAEHCGVFMPRGEGSRRQKSPPLSASDEMMSLIGRPVKYFSRMTAETQFCLCAASLALQAVKWQGDGVSEIGLLAAGFDGWLQAGKNYFSDYVASGRTLGRGHLFIYTLPTSAASAVSIALGLTGPVLHLQDDVLSLASLARRARQMAADGEAGGMLALWSDSQAAVCLAIDGGEEMGYLSAFQPKSETSPLQLARELLAMIPRL